MYCSQCGVQGSGNFCTQCGTRLGTADPVPELPSAWKEEIRYDVLLHFPEVRDLIAEAAAQAPKGISGEKFLELCDKAFAAYSHVSVNTVASIVVPIYSRIGIWTGKTRTEVLPTPPGQVLVAAVCSLARRGRQLKQVHQGHDGCVLEARVPPSLWSLEGEIVISVNRHTPETRVEAATKIPGQLYDWGKSQQCLRELFDDLQTQAA